MRLSTKLKISFGFLIILPVALFGTVLFSITKIQLHRIQEKYGIQNISYDALMNPVLLSNEMCRQEYEEIRQTAEDNPSKLRDLNYLNAINNRISKRNAYIVVIEDNDIMYQGKEISDELRAKLIESQNHNSEIRSAYLRDFNVLASRVSYMIDSHTYGTVYFVISFAEILPQIKKLLFDTMISVIIILILTSGAFTMWIYRSTVRPINKLRLATNNIKNGNLDFDMDVEGNNEFAELCKDFDNMRKRLKYNAEENVRRDSESKELISNISHDLKTPITAIKGYVEGIMDGVADTDEKMDRYIRTIYTKACDMDNLINELTFYAKVDSDKINYNFIKLNLTEYFNDCIDEIGVDLESRNIELKYINELDKETAIVADPEQFKRVINNIINNSMKYMEINNGVVELHLYNEGDDVHIDISDNGKGISPKDIGHIFDRFYRSDTSRNSRTGGSGIGLSIVKKIIIDHGGSITAESIPYEKTTIKIILDRYKEDKDEQNTDSRG